MFFPCFFSVFASLFFCFHRVSSISFILGFLVLISASIFSLLLSPCIPLFPFPPLSISLFLYVFFVLLSLKSPQCSLNLFFVVHLFLFMFLFFFPVYLFPPLYNLPVFFRPFLSWSSLGIYKGKGERATLPCAMIGAGGSWDKVRWLGRPLCNRHRVTRKAWLSSLFIIVVGHEGVWVMSGFRQVGR